MVSLEITVSGAQDLGGSEGSSEGRERRATHAPDGILDHGALEEDDPETWEARLLGAEPEAVDEGDQSRRPNAVRESESPI